MTKIQFQFIGLSILALFAWVELSLAATPRLIEITRANRSQFHNLPTTQAMRGVTCRLRKLETIRPSIIPGKLKKIRKKRFFIPTTIRRKAIIQRSACAAFAASLVSGSSSSASSSSSSSSSASAVCQPPMDFVPIETEAQLVEIADANQNYYLCNDIALANPFPILFPRAEYQGRFDGGGHKISNLRIARPDAITAGLFGLLGRSAVIRNLILENVQVEGNFGVGALAGLSDGAIENVRIINGTITGSGSGWAGALVGYQGGLISPVQCSATNVVDGNTGQLAPLIGLNRSPQ